jgi:hypothetical protein
MAELAVERRLFPFSLARGGALITVAVGEVLNAEPSTAVASGSLANKPDLRLLPGESFGDRTLDRLASAFVLDGGGTRRMVDSQNTSTPAPALTGSGRSMCAPSASVKGSGTWDMPNGDFAKASSAAISSSGVLTAPDAAGPNLALAAFFSSTGGFSDVLAIDLAWELRRLCFPVSVEGPQSTVDVFACAAQGIGLSSCFLSSMV